MTTPPARVEVSALGAVSELHLGVIAGHDFADFYLRERSALVGLAYVLSGSRSAAEDLAQDAFVAAYKNWDRISRYDDPGSWVRRVLAHRAISRFRRAGAEARALLRIRGGRLVVPDMDTDALVLWREVRRLPTRQTQVIALRYLDGRSLAAIAEILGCSENTVKTHLQRAKQTLAARLEER